MSGTHRPAFEYELDGGQRTVTVDARIEATLEETVQPPPDSTPGDRCVSSTETHPSIDVFTAAKEGVVFENLMVRSVFPLRDLIKKVGDEAVFRGAVIETDIVRCERRAVVCFGRIT